MNDMTVTSFSTINLLVSQPEFSDVHFNEKIDRAESDLTAEENGLSEKNQALLSQALRSKANQIKASIRSMRAMGFSSDVISRTVNQSIREMSDIVCQFRAGCDDFEIGKKTVCKSSAAIAERITGMDLSFPSFTPPQRSFKPDDNLHDSIRRFMVEKAMERLIEAKSTGTHRPSFSKAIEAYGKVQSLEQLKEVAGGKLKQNFDSKSFINGCASRISYVLEQTGYKIPVIPGETVSGQNGEQYIYRLTALEKFMRKTFGPPDCEWRKGSPIENSGNEKCANLLGKKGILIMRWESGPHTTCTGHATLIRGRDLSNFGHPSDGVFWELPSEIANKGGEEFDEDIQINHE